MIGVFGGTFNPIHLGHLSIAQEAFTRLSLSRVEFVPCHTPVHKADPKQAFSVTTEQRLAMLGLALQDYAQFHLNLCEIERGGASYMIDTLRSLKEQFAHQTLVLILGTDAFNGLSSWKSANAILDYCHVVICQRPDEQLKLYKQASWVNDIKSLTQSDSGSIYPLNVKPVDCSSTSIRENIMNNTDVSHFLSAPVLNFIKTNLLYEKHTQHARK